MNYDDIKDMTNEEAVAFYGQLTNGPIQSGDLENLLDWKNLANRDAVTGAWQGSLIDVLQNSPVPAIRDGLGELFSHLNKPHSKTIDTTVQPWASKMSDLIAGLEAVGAITVLTGDHVKDLGGGYAYPDLDVDAVQLIRSEEARRVLDHWAAEADEAAREAVRVKIERYASLYNTHISSLMTGTDASDATWVAAIQAMADNFTQE